MKLHNTVTKTVYAVVIIKIIGSFAGNIGGDALALGTTVSWAGYAVILAPLMTRYSPFLISSLILGIGWVPLALVSIPQLVEQRYDGFGWQLWGGAAVTVG